MITRTGEKRKKKKKKKNGTTREKFEENS